VQEHSKKISGAAAATASPVIHVRRGIKDLTRMLLFVRAEAAANSTATTIISSNILSR
jgi:hypothetical protein